MSTLLWRLVNEDDQLLGAWGLVTFSHRLDVLKLIQDVEGDWFAREYVQVKPVGFSFAISYEQSESFDVSRRIEKARRESADWLSLKEWEST